MNKTPNAVLNGGPHGGLTVDVSAHLSEIVIDGSRYTDTDTGRLHRNEQHD